MNKIIFSFLVLLDQVAYSQTSKNFGDFSAHFVSLGEDQIPFTDIHQIRRKVRQRLKHDHANQAKQDGESHLLQVHERGITYNPRIGMEQAKAYQIRNQAYQQRDQ